MKLGIDFGTCYSFASALSADLPISLVRQDCPTGIPTIFAYDNNGVEKFGREAEELEYGNPALVVRNIKRQIREFPERLAVNTEHLYLGEFTARQIIEKLLAYIINYAKSYYREQHLSDNFEVEEICVAVPETFSTLYKEVIKEAVKNILSLPDNKIHIILEPVAAAISYLEDYLSEKSNQVNSKKYILVYDLGGGTFDAAIVKYDPNSQGAKYSVMGTSGHTALGGLDWDKKMDELIKSKIGPHPDMNLAEISTYNKKVTKAKIDLSTADDTIVRFTIGAKMYRAEVTREEFEDKTKDLLDATIAAVNSALNNFEEKTSLNRNVISNIVLVGGSSYMPQVKKRLVEEYGAFVKESDIILRNPGGAISFGATVYMAKNVTFLTPKNYGVRTYNIRKKEDYDRAVESVRNGEIPEASIKDECIFIKYENTEHKIWDKKGECYYELVVSNLINKGEDVINSIKGVSTFCPHDYGGTCLSFDVYESNGVRAGGITPLLEAKLIKTVSFEFGYETSEGDEYESIMVLDKNGLLDFTVKESRNNQILHVTAENVFG